LKPNIISLEPSDSSSETDSSPSSDEASDSELKDAEHASRNNNLQDLDDDEDPVPNSTSGTYFQTKHEIVESDIVIPEVDRIGPDEILEKVGEIMNIIDRVVIIKGLPSNMLNRGSDRALDSDTLLVFDDRTVMGYVRPSFPFLSIPCPSPYRDYLTQSQGRCTKHSVRRHNLCIRSNSTLHFRWTWRG